MGPLTRRGVVPILERTQVSIELRVCLIRGIGLLDFPGFGFVSHYDQCRFALEADVLRR